METLESIFNRRSIRKFTSQSVTNEQLEIILQAGMYAPTANNKQPWQFIVVNDRLVLDEIAKIHPSSQVIKEVGLIIVLCGSKKIEETEAYIVEDCSAATQNMLLAAHALGLGSLWLGLYPRTDRVDSVKKLLQIPDDIIPVSMVAIGYAAESKSKPERFLPDRIHYNKFE